MAINDDAVIVAAQGFVYVSDPGTASPTPSQVAGLDPETFGCQTVTVTVTGTPTGGTFTLTIGGTATAGIPWNATPDQVQTAVEAVPAVGSGNTKVGGSALATGITVAFVEALQGQTLTVTGTASSLTGGTSPAVTTPTTTAVNTWTGIGHTSRGTLPEFGFDGGKLEMKGTWQKERLREVQQTSNPVEDFVTIDLEQWDDGAFELYFGTNASDTPGIFGVDGSDVPVIKAVFILIVDGSTNIGFYAPKASIQRDSAIKMTVDDFAVLPVKATFLNMGTRRIYDWISLDLFPGS